MPDVPRWLLKSIVALLNKHNECAVHCTSKYSVSLVHFVCVQVFQVLFFIFSSFFPHIHSKNYVPPRP